MGLSYTLCCVGADALRSRPSETGDTMPLSTAPRRVAAAVLAALPAALAACGGVGGVVTSQTAAAESIDYWAADERARTAVERARAAVERAKERAAEHARAVGERALAAVERAEAEGDTDAAAEHAIAAMAVATFLTLPGPDHVLMAEIDAESAGRAAMMAERHAREDERHAREAERAAGAVAPAPPARGESIDYWAAVDRALAAACAGADSMAEHHAKWAGLAALDAELAAREAERKAREAESEAREAEAAAHGP